MNKTIKPYGKWTSPIELEDIFARPSQPMYPVSYKDQLYWIEARAKEGGRQVLMRREQDGSELCLTPENYNIRTRVHEYGGICFLIVNDQIYFSNFSDQCLYRQALDANAEPQRLTPTQNADGSVGKFADFHSHPNGGWLCFVYEKEYADKENINTIAYLSLEQSAESEPTNIVEGGDFYASPQISPDGQRLAWMEWDHPDMPWDHSRVGMAEIRQADHSPQFVGVKVVAGGRDQSVCQLVFGLDNSLYFCKDKQSTEDSIDNYWNIYAYKDNALRIITKDLAGYGEPHWVFGESRVIPIAQGQLVAVRTSSVGDELVHIDCHSGSAQVIKSSYNHFAQLTPISTNGGSNISTYQSDLLMLAASGKLEPELIRCDTRAKSFDVLKHSPPILSDDNISCAEAIAYPTDGGDRAYAYYYAPKNSAYQAPANTRPPLLVLVHGGPTSRTDPNFAAAKQYWTSQGYALLDVNHRGSTGYGRSYRQSLLGYWGERDANDIANGVRQLIAEKRVDDNRICIRGGSAGGYAVLRALTQFPELFSVGACYYGIGNLITLALTTHKFEARYLDGLLGEVFDPEYANSKSSVFTTRSPINHLSKLRSPMILFQGEEDRVVPPEVSQEVVNALKSLGIDHEYQEYAGEAHGFRRSETRVDALSREAAFYCRILAF